MIRTLIVASLILFVTVSAQGSQSAGGGQSALDSAGGHAANIEILWWLMFFGACLIFALVMAMLGIGMWRSRRAGQSLSDQASRNLVIVAGVAIPLVVLITLVGGSLMLGQSLATEPPDDALQVRVTGWMWWWEIEYLDDTGRVVATTANELHIPVGRPVALQLTSGDVIHSFWVPQLHGKTDMVPGSVTTSWFTADRPGVFRGQCAEFCGMQHALMAFHVVAEPQAVFDQWLDRQSQPAQRPQRAATRRGLQVFLNDGCADCHTVRGTAAGGDSGPDLTHLASRRALAAATLPNNRGHLSGWIADPQAAKAGSFMPPTRLTPQDLDALTDYLQSLE